MSKPKWLVSAEKRKTCIGRHEKPCSDCIHYGDRPVAFAKHKGKEKVAVFECAKRGCLNTKYSLACDDWEQAQLI